MKKLVLICSLIVLCFGAQIDVNIDVKVKGLDKVIEAESSYKSTHVYNKILKDLLDGIKINSTGMMTRQSYVKALEELSDNRAYSKFITQIESNSIYPALTYTPEAVFREIMQLSIADLMSATETYGRPDESSKAKRTFYKLARTGNFYNKFDVFMLSAAENIKQIAQSATNAYGDIRKCTEISEAMQVMSRLEIFLNSFNKDLADFGFTSSDKEMVQSYYLKYGNKICE